MLAAFSLGMGGCGSEQAPRLVDYLEDLEFDAPADATVEVPLGSYHVPVAIPTRGKEDLTWRRLKFSLYAVTEANREKSLLEVLEHRKGPFQDEVLRIVRNVTTDELEDPRLSSVKMRLTDMARAQLGESRVQQLVIVGTLEEPI
ncbi:MAG: hypothetical protein RID07_17435 [Lacipirellulaceae bacterium]